MVSSHATSKLLPALTLSLLLLIAAASSPKWCGIAERGQKCGGGTCQVKGWERRCTPSCSHRTVKCGNPIGNAWRDSQRCYSGAGCMTDNAKCSMRCEKRSKRHCKWRQRMRWRTKLASRRVWNKVSYGKWEPDWVHRSFRRRLLVWVPICNTYRFMVCSCWANPCQCDLSTSRMAVPSPNTRLIVW